MKTIRGVIVSLLLIGVWSCNPKEPEPDLPDYLQMPSSLSNYKGSGRVTVSGGLTLQAEGPERKTGNNWTGVLAAGVIDGIAIDATFEQPLNFDERNTVPEQYRSYGTFRIENTKAVGTYPMGLMTPNPRGEIGDIFLYRPGARVYIAKEGSLTVEESTLIKVEGNKSLYRIRGNFDANLIGDGPGVTERYPNVTGTFDVLSVSTTL